MENPVHEVLALLAWDYWPIMVAAVPAAVTAVLVGGPLLMSDLSRRGTPLAWRARNNLPAAAYFAALFLLAAVSADGPHLTAGGAAGPFYVYR